MRPHQVDEPNIFNGFYMGLAIDFFKQFQFLRILIPDRYDHFTRVGKLFDKWLRDVWPTRCYNDSLERSFGTPALGAVIQSGGDVVIVELIKNFPGPDKERVDPLDCIDPVTDPREYRGLISGPGTDLKHSFVTLELKSLGHEGYNIWLGNCLTGPDGQGVVAICTGSQGIVDK
jgi:hypothetical protein